MTERRGIAPAPTMARYLIVNADDFGQSDGVNRGIVRAHREGIITSASLMVRWPAAPAAAEHARTNPRLGLGLHLDLGEWRLENGEWRPLYQVCPLEPDAIEDEVGRQLERFRDLTGAEPDHLDSHQHVHRREPAAGVVSRIASALGLPLRGSSPEIRYCGEFYGQGEGGESLPGAVTAAALTAILRRLEPGTTELACHPATVADLETMYRDERLFELEALCDASVRRAIEEHGIVLCSFAETTWRGRGWRNVP